MNNKRILQLLEAFEQNLLNNLKEDNTFKNPKNFAVTTNFETIERIIKRLQASNSKAANSILPRVINLKKCGCMLWEQNQIIWKLLILILNGYITHEKNLI